MVISVTISQAVLNLRHTCTSPVLLISGIHFFSHSLRKESSRMSQVLSVDRVDRLTFHRPKRLKPHFKSCQKCPKTVHLSNEDVPMDILWENEGIPLSIAWDMAERVPRLLRAIGPPLRQGPKDPLEAILVIFGRRALIFFLKGLGKYEKWLHFCVNHVCAQLWSPWRRKSVEKRHLASSNLTFFVLIAINRNGFRRMKEEGQIYKMLPQIF